MIEIKQDLVKTYFKTEQPVPLFKCAGLGSVRFALDVVGCLGHACDAAQ